MTDIASTTKSVLVTGGAGYIGSHVVLALLEAGHKVVVVDNLATGFREAMPPSVPLVVGDIGDRALLRGVIRDHRCQSVMHFAASVVAPQSVSEPIAYYQNNLLNTANLVNACIDECVSNLVFSSTAAIYGLAPGGVVSEISPCVPISPYGRSKLACEWIVEDVARVSGLRYMALRYFNVAGADPDLRVGQRTKYATHLIKVACEAALGMRSKVEVFGSDYPTTDGTGVRDYIHVHDLGAAHLAALKHLESGGESLTLNVGYGRGYSVREVIDAVQRVSGVSITVDVAPRRPGDPPMIVADATKIRASLDWTPRLQDIDVIIKHSWLWQRKLRDEASATRT